MKAYMENPEWGRQPPYRLEIGSGYAPTPGFVHLDANEALPLVYECPLRSGRNEPHVDIRGTAFPIALRDDSVDEIRAVDVAEHVSYRDTAAMFSEWARVLRPGGSLYVQVPDAALVLAWWATGAYDELVNRLPADLVTGALESDAWTGVQWRLLGGHADGVAVHEGDDFRLNAHYSLWTEASLRMALAGAGFTVESWTVNLHPNHQVVARKV